jgi:hypothetical protein
MSYKIISTKDAFKIIENNTPQGGSRIENITTCVVYEFKNGSAIIIPFESSTSALFEDKEECFKFVEDEAIEKIRTGNIFENLKKEIINIESTWFGFTLTLISELNREILITSEIKYLNLLSQDFEKYGKKNIESKLFIPLGIYLNTIIKSIVKGNWEIEEVNKGTKYIFYIPHIKDNEGKLYSAWNALYKSIHEKKKIDLVDIIIKSSIYWNLENFEGLIIKKKN